MTPATRLDPFSLYLLLTATLLAGLPHHEHLPSWVTPLAATLWLWRLYLAHRDLRLPNRWMLSAFTLAGAMGIYFHFRTLFGRDAGVTLLVLMLAFKLLETKTRRDAMIVVFLGYFLVVTNFLYSQTVATATYMLFVIWLITFTMIGFQQRAPRTEWKVAASTGAMLLVQAVPLMLVMFLFFPRVQGPLWGLPQEGYSATSGLSDTMSPGSLSALSMSDAVAFRAQFEGAAPNRARLYWRGPVLWDFDGKTWRMGAPMRGTAPEYLGLDEPVRYTVTVEPHHKPWLFAVDLPAIVPEGSRVTPDFQILFDRTVQHRIRYEMTSYLSYRMAPMRPTRDEVMRGVQLPPGIAPRARALAARIRSEAQSTQGVLLATLNFFRNQHFFYTLNPPALGEDPIDEFLFGTRRGFCEHYASAFAVLMRAAGVPARIVTGYQGGTFNPVSDYLIVRQADAHAWVEVWLDNQGWVRVDPTAAVSPQRLDAGLAAAVPEGDPVPFLARDDLAWLRAALYRWDTLAHTWNQWVLGYNPERQRRFLSDVGMDDSTWHTMAIALLAVTGLVLVLLAGFLLLSLRAHRRDPVQRAWQRFCAKLAREGAPRLRHEGPNDYAKRISARFPLAARDVRTISDLYVQLRYGRLEGEDQVRLLKSLVADFKVSGTLRLAGPAGGKPELGKS